MAIVKRVSLGSSVRRVKPPKPIPGVDPVIAYEHLYHEIVFVRAGGAENGLPPVGPAVGVPEFPDNALPGDQPSIDNALPEFSRGWPGCPSIDNSLPGPDYDVDHDLPVSGGPSQGADFINNDLPLGPEPKH